MSNDKKGEPQKPNCKELATKFRETANNPNLTGQAKADILVSTANQCPIEHPAPMPIIRGTLPPRQEIKL